MILDRSMSDATRVPVAGRAWRWTRAGGAASLLLLLAACSSGERAAPATPAADVHPVPVAGSAASRASDEAQPRIVVLGDSLTAGLGLDRDEAFPSHLQSLIDDAGLEYAVVNMGVSGDTSAGGLRRLDWALEGDVRVLIVALGGNDGLRGLAPDDLERNLEGIIERAQARGIQVLLCGMEAPPNFGGAYTRAFRNVYPQLAQEHGVVLLPFLLEGVAGVPSLNQPDGIHPTAEGARRVAALVWARLAPMLQDSPSR
jgi:acyl-CoA thioesterase-1